ncbi:hypothetical protein I4U23_014543 [Adineta vaga]|nr:hypothetical protein I4U23_014543 [Adineta vaga]
MFSLISIIFVFMLQKFVCAEDKSNMIVWHYSFTVGIVSGTALCTIIGTCLAYLIVRNLKKKLSPPAYCVADVPMEKNGGEHFNGDDNYIVAEMPNLCQVQPILTVSEVVSSYKQSFDTLGDAILPRRWTRSKQVVKQENPVEEKTEVTF